MQHEQLHSLREAGKRFSVSPWTVLRAINRGEIRGVRIGRHWRISDKEIARVIRGGTKARNAVSRRVSEGNT